MQADFSLSYTYRYYRKGVEIMSETKQTGRTQVSLIKAETREEGVKKSVDALAVNPVKDKKVMLKPNFNTADRYPGSTHPQTLRELIIYLQEMGADQITIGERAGPPNTAEVMEDLGVFQLAEELNVDIVNFDELSSDQLVKVEVPDGHWDDGFVVPRALKEAECVVSTPCLKTHQYGGVFTMALKLAVGIIPKENTDYMKQMHDSPDMRRMIAEINVGYSPDLIVLDGMEAFVDGGPMEGTRKRADLFLAGTDRIAVDAVGVSILKELGSTPEIMDKKVFQQEQISRAVELGLGVSSPQDIEIITDENPESQQYAEKISSILKEG